MSFYILHQYPDLHTTESEAGGRAILYRQIRQKRGAESGGMSRNMSGSGVPLLSGQGRQRSLPEEMNAMTRRSHTKLNKLIVSRLPLALPPRTADPSTYVTGLLHIANIYIAIEKQWQDILDSSPAASSPTNTPNGERVAYAISDSRLPGPEIPPRMFPNFVGEDHQELLCDRLHAALTHLYLPGLMRSSSLHADIRALTGWTDNAMAEQLELVGQTGRLAEFVKHIQRSITAKPHVLLAYSHILYMALFSGGRFIRASLEAVGEHFWEHVPSPVRPSLAACQRVEKGEGKGGMVAIVWARAQA